MKKILGLAVLGLLLGEAPVLAQGTVSVANVTAQPGATVDVPVYVSDLPQIGGASISIQMVAPTGAPALVAGEAVKGTVFPNANDVIQTDLTIPGQVQVVAVSPGVSKGPGTLFTVPITVPAAATAGTTYQLHVTRTEVVDAANNPLAVTARDGSLTVAQAVTPVVSVASTSGAPGQTINLAVNVSEGAKGLGGGSVELYMPGLTVAGDAVNGNVFTGPNVVVSTDRTKPNQPVVVVVTSTSGNGPGTLFTIPVTIPANATPGQVFPVMLGAVDIIDTSNNTIPVGKQDGTVTVVAQITATVRVAPTSAAAGTTAMVSIEAGAGVQNLAAIRMTLDLGALSASGDATLAGGLFAGIPNTQLATDRSNPSQPKIILVSPGAVNGPGTLFTIPVPVPANATPGTLLPINITAVEALDSNNQPLPIVAETGGGILVLAAGQYIQVNPETVAPGQTFNLAVSIGPGVQGVAGIRTTLNLGGLTAAGPATRDGTLFANVPNTIVQTDLTNPGRPGVILVSPGAVNGPGLLFTIPVTVPATAKDGDVFQVNLEGLEVIDQNNQPMPLPIAPGSGVITVRSVGAGVISVVSVTGVNPGDTINLQIAANDKVIGLAGARFGLNLGGLTATGNATLAGGIFAGIANTQISTNLANPGAPEVILVSPGAANGPGTVFSIPVQIPTTATTGQVFTIGLTVSDAIDANNQPLPVAAQGGTVTVGPGPTVGVVSVQSTTGAPGATINLTIAADANVKDLGGARFALDLGPMTATGDAVLTGGIFANVANTQIATDRTNPSRPQIIIVSAGSASGPGAVFTIPVQIPSTAAPNTTIPVGLSVAEAINSQNQPIQLVAQGGTVTVQQAGVIGIVRVADISGAAGSVVNLAIAADENVKDLAGARFGLDLGGLSATGDATIAGGIFANVANTRIATDRTDAGKPQVILVSAGSANGPGTVFTIPVQIPASATAGQKFTVTLTVSDAINSQNQTIQLTAQPGTVTVSGVPPIGVVSVQSQTGVAPGSRINLAIAADANVKDLGGVRFALDLGGLTATGDATVAGGIFANVPNTQISTNRTDAGKPQIIIVSAGAANGPGTVFTIPVQVPTTATDGQVFTIGLTVTEAVNSQNQPIQLTAQGGTVTVKVGPPPVAGIVKVVDISGAAGSVINLAIAADENVKDLAGARFGLDLGGLSATGDATIAGGIFANVANTRIATDRTDAGKPQVILVSAGSANGPGTVFTIPVQIPASATAGQKFTVTLTVSDAINSQNQTIQLTAQPGTVTVSGVPPIGVVKVQDLTVAAGSTANLVVTADENVKNLGGARVALDLGPLTATGDATLTGGIFANVANTQIATDRTDPSKPQVILVSAGAASGPGTLFSLPISVPLDQAGKTITVSITSSEFIDAQNQTMNITVASGTVTVTGAPPTNIVLSVGSTEGPIGGTVQLPISLNDQAKNIGAVRVTLNVGALTPSQATKGELLAAEDQIGTNITPGQADVIVVIAHAANGPGVLFNLPLTIPANATDGQVFPVTVTHLEMIDTAGNPLAATSTPGQVVARAALVNVISLSVANVAPNTASPVRVRVDGAQSMAGIDLTVTYDGRLGKFDPTTVAATGIAGADTQIRADDTAGTGNNRILRIIMVSPHTLPEGQSGTIATINFVGAGPDSLHPLDSTLLMPTAVTMVDANNVESDITAKARPGGLIAGAWVFNARFDLPNAGNISSSVSIVGNQVYFGDTLGRLYALDATTGQPLFAQGADLGGGAVIGRPTIKNDAVYAVTSTGRVAKVAAAGAAGAGTVLWSVPALPGGPADDAAPAVQEDANGTTYVFVGDAAGRIHKLNAQTGAEVLSAALPNNQPLTTTPAVGLMAPPLFDLWAGAAKSILRINADDLTVRSPSPIATQGNVLSPILVYPILTATGADRIVVAGDDSGHVNLLSATTGAPIGAGSYAASGPVIGATVVSVDSNGLANFVYVPCTDGSIHRIAIPSGTGSALVTGLTRPSDGAPISLDQAVIVVAKPGSTDEFVYAPGSVTTGGQTNGVISILNVANTATRFGVQVPGKPGAPAYSPNGNVVVVGSSIGAVVALPAQ